MPRVRDRVNSSRWWSAPPTSTTSMQNRRGDKSQMSPQRRRGGNHRCRHLRRRAAIFCSTIIDDVFVLVAIARRGPLFSLLAEFADQALELALIGGRRRVYELRDVPVHLPAPPVHGK